VITALITRNNPHRATYGLPVVVPPVSHKSSVLPDALQDVWRLAEQALRGADSLVIFGYSCPALDVESSSLLRRSLRAQQPRVTVIDPAPAVVARYVDLVRPERLSYYPSASDYLADDIARRTL
jgi:hypothetical protein